MRRPAARILLASVLVGLVFVVRPGLRPPTPPAAGPPDWSIPALLEGEAVERCFVLGDMGTGLPGQHEVARRMAARAERVGLDFLLTVGDNFYPDGVVSPDDPQWATKFEEVYAFPSLAVPVFPTLGNHDHRGDVDAQVSYSSRNPRWHMPARWYMVPRTLADGTRLEFFAIDTEALRKGDENSRRSQLEWLDRALETSAARWKVVFGHHPPFTHGHHDGSGTIRRLVVPLLEEHGVDLFLGGHNHHLEVLTPKNGVEYVVAGAAGGPEKAYEIEWADDTVYTSTGGGYLAVLLSRRRLVLECVRLDGETDFAHVLEKD